MIFKLICFFCVVLKLSRSSSTIFKEKTSMKTYSIVDLVENVRLNSRVIQFDDQWRTEKNKLILLNLNGFEKEMFSIINGSIFTSSEIDREEMLEKKRCLDPLYCLIELHLIVNDAAEYWIVPIHIVDENDNDAKFYQNEIELKFNEKIVNGYQIPFVGAKDLDEGANGQICYFLDCSTSIEIPMENQTFNTNNQSKSLSKNCFPLFDLVILSQTSSSNHFDQLALKYRPSTKFVPTRNKFHLILYAMDQNSNGNRRETSMKISVKINEKTKSFLKFSLSTYEFVLTLNETMNERIDVGRVYAMTNDPSERIHYELISTNVENRKFDEIVQINSLTGELFLQKKNFSKFIDEIHCQVRASILFNRKSVENVQVKIFLRYVDLLNKISFDFQNLSTNFLKQIDRSSFNYSFVLNENFDKNQTNLFEISIRSAFYPTDRYLLSLENYSKIFSIVSSSTSANNVYQLQIKNSQQFSEEKSFQLEFSLKHQLSQQYLSNLHVHLSFAEATTTTIVTLIDEENYDDEPIELITTSTFQPEEFSLSKANETGEWCVEKSDFILYDIEPIGYLKVIRSMNFSLSNDSSPLLMRKLNEKELIVDRCRMSFELINSAQLNRSTFLQLCSTFSSTNNCFNVTTLKSIDEQNEIDENFLSVRSIEIFISIISIIFLFISILLVFLICRLKGFNLCKTVQNYFYDHKYSFKRGSHLSSMKQTMGKMDPMMIDVQCRSSSFLTPKIKNEIYDVDRNLWQQQPAFSSTTLFLSSSVSNENLPALLFNPTNSQIFFNKNNELILSSPPPPPPSTSSSMTTTSSSFLRETKHLLDLISTNYQTNESKLISEV